MEVQGDGSFCYKTDGGVRYTLRNVDIGGIQSYSVGPPPPTIQIRPSRVRAFTVTPRINQSNQGNNDGRSGSNQGYRTRTTLMRTRDRNAEANGQNGAGGNVRARRRGNDTDEVFNNPHRNPKAALSMSDEFVAQLVVHIVRPHENSGNMANGISDGEQQDRKIPMGKGKLPGKLDLDGSRVKAKPPPPLEREGKKLTDFDAIMKRRKNHVDTIDDAGRLLGALSTSGDGVHGRRRRSRLWNMVRECLKEKSYLAFAHKRITSFR